MEKHIRDIISQYHTPFYLYDQNRLQQTCRHVREMLPGISLCFAMKAAPVLAGLMEGIVDRLEVCSPGEFEICRRAGIAPEKILISGVNKSPESVHRFLECEGDKGWFTIESERQLRLLEEGAQKTGRSLRCYIRLSGGNQFGVDTESFWKILDAVEASRYLTFTGVHFFSGTQKADARIEKELGMLSDFGSRIAQRTGRKAELEYGPGLAISYFETKKKDPESEDSLQKLAQSAETSKIRDSFSGIIFEYGRFLTAEGGDYYTGVADLKQTEGVNYAILEGGIHQVAYYGSMSGMKIPRIEVAGREETKETETKDYVLAGSLCSVNDIPARSVSLPGLSLGDVLRFPLAGAYALTEVPALFLSRDLPAILLLTNEQEIRVLRDHMETNRINDGSVSL